MTTYADTVYSALLTAEQPLSSRALFDQHDTLETIERVNSTLSYLVKQGRAEVVGTEKPSNGKTIRLYRALTPDEQIERQPSAPADLDQQLAEAIRARDTETAEAVMDDDHGLDPLFGEWPDEAVTALQYDPDDVAFKRHRTDGLIDATPPLPLRTGLRMLDRSVTDDPIINAMHRLQIKRPAIQNIGTDIRRARALARVIGDAGADVSGWLNELADKLEYIA